MGYTLGNIATQSVIAVSLTPVEVTTVVAAEQTFTVNGLKAGDIVSGFHLSGAIGTACSATSARVSAANTLAVIFNNPTAGNLTPTAGTYKFILSRPDSNKSDGNI
jgi:hypothetical protein